MCELFEPSPDTEDLVQILLDCSKVITYWTLQKTENHPKKT